MKRLTLGILFVVAMLGVSGSVVGQEPTATPQSPQFTLQVKSQIVVLDVVVTNKQGDSVPGLTKDAFTVYENKVPQTILSFEPSGAKGVGAAAAPVQVNSTEELDRLEPRAPVSIIVLDEVTTKFEDEAFARYSLKRYLDTQGEVLTQPTMLMAVNTKNSQVLRDYTTSKAQVLAALEHHFATVNWEAQSDNSKSQQFNASFASLIGVAQATQGHPGHKNVVWVGRGFPGLNMVTLPPEQFDQIQAVIASCANILRDARVTLYSIDPAGLSAAEPQTDEDGFYEDDPFGGNVDFDTMVRATGGQAFHGRNDVDHLIQSAVRDGETFYTISYRPTGTDGGDVEKPFRNIKVAMNDKSLHASTRMGYYATQAAVPPAMEAKGKASQRLMFDLQVAGQGLMIYDGLPLTIVRDPASPDKFKLQIKTSALQWESGAADQRKAVVALMVESYDRKGKLLSHTASMIGVNQPQVVEGQADNGVATISTTVATAAPAARLRFVVRESVSGKMGADNVFLVDKKTLDDPATGMKRGK